MTKENYIKTHEALITEYMEKFPGMSYEEAYEQAADLAYEKYLEGLADLADRLNRKM